MSTFNIKYAFILSSLLHIIFPLNLVKFPFKREINVTSNDKPSEIMSKIFFNNMITTVKIGSPETQRITVSISLQKYPFYIVSSQFLNNKTISDFYSERSLENFYFLNESKSKSLEIKENFTNFTHIHQDFKRAKGARDTIDFGSSKEKMNFLLVSEMNFAFYLKSEGNIGLNLYNNDKSTDKYNDYNFITQLKRSGLISSYNFYIKFKDQKDIFMSEGELIIGPDLDYVQKDIKKQAHKINADKNLYNEIKWALDFKIIYINNYPYRLYTPTLFLYELGVIKANTNALNLFESLFFKKYIDKNVCFTDVFNIDNFDGFSEDNFDLKFNGEYKFYYCKSETEIAYNQFPNLTFYHNSFNFNITFTYQDLFIEVNGYKIFLIVGSFKDTDWAFGAPFFRKYDTVFNFDEKSICVFDGEVKEEKGDRKESGEKSESLNKVEGKFILVVALFVIVFVILCVILIKTCRLIPRKQKANELEEEFSYKENRYVMNNN